MQVPVTRLAVNKTRTGDGQITDHRPLTTGGG
jgi:hypothetical protein